MNGKEEKTSIALTAPQQSRDLQSSSIPSNRTGGTEKQELDRNSSPIHKFLKIALLSLVAVIGVLVLLLPSIAYYLPLPSRDGAGGSQSNVSSAFILGNGSSGQGESSIQTPLGRLFNCSTLQCQEGFSCSAMGNTSLCLPVCGRWAQYPRGTVVAIDVVIILSAAICVIASIAVLGLSCIQWKRMFTFPSVFVVYTTITVMITAVFALISHMDRRSLYCASEYLTDAVQSTSFCMLSGIVFYYGVFQVAVWWFCHVVSLFWWIQFPFHAQSFKSAHRVKYIHISMVIVGLILPALPVIVAFTAGEPSGRGFGLSTFPPTNCDSLQSPPVTFYSLVLPVNLILVTGIPLLVVIFWTIHKQHGLLRVKKSKHPLQISTSERKILIVLCYYILLSVVALTGVTVPLRNAQLLTIALMEYWQCEAAGVHPLCNRLRASFEEQTNPGIITVSYMLLWIFPAVNLIFAVNVSELKQKFKTWRGQAALSQNTSYKASNETE